MKYSLDELITMKEEVLLEKLKETYQAQKLTKTQGYIARTIEIFFGIFILFSGIGFIYSLLIIAGLIYSIYRFLHPNGEDEDYYKNFETVVQGFHNYKKYKKSELNLELNEKQVKSLEKHLAKWMTQLLNTSFFLKLIAFVPILNLRADELSNYRDTNGALNRVLYGTIKGIGLSNFLEDTKKSN